MITWRLRFIASQGTSSRTTPNMFSSMHGGSGRRIRFVLIEHNKQFSNVPHAQVKRNVGLIEETVRVVRSTQV